MKHLLAFAAAFVPAAASAQTGAGQGEAVVVRPLSVVKVDDLRFGTLVAGSAAGQAMISQTSGARAVTGGVTGVGGDFGPASFRAAGLANILAIISVNTGTTITRVGGGASMTVSDLATNRAALTVLPASGVLDINVGGRLSVAANQLPGDYAGSFTLTVIYL